MCNLHFTVTGCRFSVPAVTTHCVSACVMESVDSQLASRHTPHRHRTGTVELWDVPHDGEHTSNTHEGPQFQWQYHSHCQWIGARQAAYMCSCRFRPWPDKRETFMKTFMLCGTGTIANTQIGPQTCLNELHTDRAPCCATIGFNTDCVIMLLMGLAVQWWMLPQLAQSPLESLSHICISGFGGSGSSPLWPQFDAFS